MTPKPRKTIIATGPEPATRFESAGAGQPLLVRRALAPEVADAFLRTIWHDIHGQRVEFQTHKQKLLQKNALEVHGRHHGPMSGLHWGLTSLIAERVKAEVVPSFAFFRMYFKDDVCRVHSDRPACEVSLSLTIAYSDGHPWDLSIGTATDFDRCAVDEDFGAEPFNSFAMEPGDGVLYHGSVRRHGRVVPNPNRWSAHLFLHWVDPEGPYKNEAFERLDLGSRPMI